MASVTVWPSLNHGRPAGTKSTWSRAHLRTHVLGHSQVSVVDRIEGAAEDADPHLFPLQLVLADDVGVTRPDAGTLERGDHSLPPQLVVELDSRAPVVQDRPFPRTAWQPGVSPHTCPAPFYESWGAGRSERAGGQARRPRLLPASLRNLYDFPFLSLCFLAGDDLRASATS